MNTPRLWNHLTAPLLCCTFLGLSACVEPLTLEQFAAECHESPNYVFNTPEEISRLEGKRNGPVGGDIFSYQMPYRCRAKGVHEFWDDPDPNVQYTLQVLREVTGSDDPEAVDRITGEMEVIDLRAYPELYDLRPLSFTTKTQEIYLPPEARIRSLWSFQSKSAPRVLDAPGLTVDGTRPEDCPTHNELILNNVIGPLDYPPSVVQLCRQLRGLP